MLQAASIAQGAGDDEYRNGETVQGEPAIEPAPDHRRRKSATQGRKGAGIVNTFRGQAPRERLRPLMRKSCFVVLLAGVMLATAVAAIAAPHRKAPPVASFASAEAVLAWISGYTARPEPQRLPAAVHALIAGGAFKDIDQAGMYIGFIAGVLNTDPAGARKLVTAMFPMAPEHQVVVIKAIALSGLADWKTLLGEVAERMPARAAMVEKYLYRKAPTLDITREAGAFAIDANWGFYFATGSDVPVVRIIRTLAWASDKSDLERLTLGSMAKWTLATNAQRSLDLLRTCKGAMAGQPKEVSVHLADAIDAAETYEISRLRRSALASIDEVKTKGPQGGSGWQWWGQTGTTVLALGCVVASALGQAEIGIPCVVGGALASAGTRYLPQ